MFCDSYNGENLILELKFKTALTFDWMDGVRFSSLIMFDVVFYTTSCSVMAPSRKCSGEFLYLCKNVV